MVAIFQAIILKEKLTSAILERYSTLTQKEFYTCDVKDTSDDRNVSRPCLTRGLNTVLVATVQSSLLKSEADIAFVKLLGSG